MYKINTHNISGVRSYSVILTEGMNVKVRENRFIQLKNKLITTNGFKLLEKLYSKVVVSILTHFFWVKTTTTLVRTKIYCIME